MIRVVWNHWFWAHCSFFREVNREVVFRFELPVSKFRFQPINFIFTGNFLGFDSLQVEITQQFSKKRSHLIDSVELSIDRFTDWTCLLFFGTHWFPFECIRFFVCNHFKCRNSVVSFHRRISVVRIYFIVASRSPHSFERLSLLNFGGGKTVNRVFRSKNSFNCRNECSYFGILALF